MIHLASKIARKSSFKFRLGAVIVKSGNVVSTGCNEIRYTSIRFPKKAPDSLHAEQAAILPLLRKRSFNKLQGATMFVSRIDKEGRSRLAKPCNVCLKLIHAVGIKRIIYSTEHGDREWTQLKQS